MKHDKSKKVKDVVEQENLKNVFLTPLAKSKLLIISSIIIVGFTLSVLYHFILVHYLGHDEYPSFTFMFKPWDSFMDFFNIYKQTSSLDPYKEFANYFPLTFIFVYVFTIFPPVVAFFLFAGSFILFFQLFVYHYLPRMNVPNRILLTFILSFMSYPFLWTLDRGNLESWVFISVALFIHFYLKGKDALSILFLSIAISLKLYPAILVILFFYNRKKLYIIYTAIVTLLISMISGAMLHGGLKATLNGISMGLSAFSDVMTVGPQGLQHNTSLYAPLRLLFDYIIIRKDIFSLRNDQLFYNGYYIFAMILFGILSFFLYRYKFSLWKKVTLLVFSFIVLPQISFDYKLVSATIPLMLYIRSDEVSKYNLYYAIIFGLLLIPKDYYIIVSDISISIIINPLLIVLLVSLMLKEAVPALHKGKLKSTVKMENKNSRDRRIKV